MTEIQWLVDIILHNKVPGPLMEKFVARIGEVEAQLSRPIITQRPVPTTGPVQVASTQRILDQIANETPLVKAAVSIPSVVDKETGRAMVNTGKGTSGPRKF